MRYYKCLSCLFFFLFINAYPEKEKTFWIHADIAKMRLKPKPSSEIVGRLRINTKVHIIKQKKDWAKVKHNGVLGWIHRSLLKNKSLLHTDIVDKVYLVKDSIALTKWLDRLIAFSPEKKESWQLFLEEYPRQKKFKRNWAQQNLRGNVPIYVGIVESENMYVGSKPSKEHKAYFLGIIDSLGDFTSFYPLLFNEGGPEDFPPKFMNSLNGKNINPWDNNFSAWKKYLKSKISEISILPWFSYNQSLKVHEKILNSPFASPKIDKHQRIFMGVCPTISATDSKQQSANGKHSSNKGYKTPFKFIFSQPLQYNKNYGVLTLPNHSKSFIDTLRKEAQSKHLYGPYYPNFLKAIHLEKIGKTPFIYQKFEWFSKEDIPVGENHLIVNSKGKTIWRTKSEPSTEKMYNEFFWFNHPFWEQNKILGMGLLPFISGTGGTTSFYLINIEKDTLKYQCISVWGGGS